MFQLKPNPTFWVTVEIHRPGEGATPLEIEFRHMGTSAALDLAREISAGMPRDRRLEVLEMIVTGWRGADAEFSTRALRQAAEDFPALASEVMVAYLQELQGARRKN